MREGGECGGGGAVGGDGKGLGRGTTPSEPEKHLDVV